MSLDFKMPYYHQLSPEDKRLVDKWREIMVFACMHTGMQAVTVKNLPEWRFRIEVLSATGIFLSYHDTKKGMVRDNPFLDVLRAFAEAGLTTNVEQVTRAKFMRKMCTTLGGIAEQAIRCQDKAIAKAAKETP